MTASLRSWLTVVRSCQAGSSRCPAPRTTTVTEGCSPRKCGRGVTDTVITRDEAQRIRSIAEKGLSLGGSEGGASILDLHSGALSVGKHFVNLYRYFGDKIQTVFAEEDFQLYRHVRQKVQLAIAQAFGISASSLYLTKPTFFSRINSTEARTAHDEYWRAHVDKVTYGSFDYTSLLYLSDYLDDFGGGRFVFMDEGANRTVEPRAGKYEGWLTVADHVTAAAPHMLILRMQTEEHMGRTLMTVLSGSCVWEASPGPLSGASAWTGEGS
ncbi:2-oxoglutarate and iron-dependent oxygenase domain-containing protein 3 isoform X5 [Manis pentadactyla]|uniref:2-oxoglutarate and iron-dependent oxygenase domain-containing protein 3 isoform X5 n=1 Tax=Manis pentadactyla TaxID=143292 RepID=UPI00255C2DB7|nr:2-oxoglutarate and iron-dependent oxygenase domain-containing protein 3 isoform X5 [Manis pentadactyla]XP_057357878.1 2-oxoglutarate and iron-dependent oxygenase domain-containing protein 3 isoform X5 [Manis pentadactyla]XP_057357879.1 2-oxoglutarate and iron-dependent oxygenase domain-containing protein 3 isoform X5 [Manis pentadactyla]